MHAQGQEFLRNCIQENGINGFHDLLDDLASRVPVRFRALDGGDAGSALQY